MSAPRLSVVLIVYDMVSQAMNTIQSLLPPYQQGVGTEEYEVIVVENRSARTLDPAALAGFGPQLRYELRDEPGVSPGPAINAGLALARGRMVGVLIDGARMLSPGVIANVLRAEAIATDPVVAVPGYQLGPEPHNRSEAHNVDRDRALLAGIDWPAAGYRLFEVSSFSEANRNGVFRPFMECNALFAPARLLAEIGGAHPGFDQPGGGALNLWLFYQLVSHPDATYVVLPGEGSFHQVHGGVTTRPQADKEALYESFSRRLDEILGHPDKVMRIPPLLRGTLPPEFHDHLLFSARSFHKKVERDRRNAATGKSSP